MADTARELSPALRPYRGWVTDPARWALFRPRPGDVIVCTPSKSGTTWTQTIVAMLLHGGPDLPAPMHAISPWIDAGFSPAGEVMASVEAQGGRRVVKTHTPADGFPRWDGVQVVAVYRHPLDVLLSHRRHATNIRAGTGALGVEPHAALDIFLKRQADITNFDDDSLASLAVHYRQTALSGRIPDLVLLHYADMLRDGAAAVARIAAGIGVAATPGLIDAIARATGFAEMKSAAARFVPEGGRGFWNDETAFFDRGGAGKWAGQFSDAELADYRRRLGEELPDRETRDWLEYGGTLRGRPGLAAAQGTT